jgi:L-seryl-tRNA(Ser) seleniumtransferase
MLDEPAEPVRERAERLAGLVGGEVEETVARVGGGALPLAELDSFACAIEESLAAALRSGDPAIVGIVRDGRLLLDARTLMAEDVDEVARAVLRARRASISA